MARREFSFVVFGLVLEVVFFFVLPLLLLVWLGVQSALVHFGFKENPAIPGRLLTAQVVTQARRLDAYYAKHGAWPKTTAALAEDLLGNRHLEQWTSPVPGSAVAELSGLAAERCASVKFKREDENTDFVLPSGWEVSCTEGPRLLLVKLHS